LLYFEILKKSQKGKKFGEKDIRKEFAKGFLQKKD
jgi:hypothetical protein